MAQKVTVALEDDLTGGPAAETLRFAFDGTDYEIDLNAKNGTAFRKQLAPYVEHARKTGRAQARRAERAASNRQRSGDIRAWAKNTAWRSVAAAAFRPAWHSSTTRQAAGANAGSRCPYRPTGRTAPPHQPG